jgi:hypothetical protein
MDEYGKKYSRMVSVEKTRQDKIRGFECGANYGKSCNFHGFYAYRYSQEGLCNECELNEFLQRYHSC